MQQVLSYVGITGKAIAIRAAEHSASNAATAALRYRAVAGGSGLTKQAARVMEQRLINQ